MNPFRERQPELFIIRLALFGVFGVGVWAGIDYYILRPLKSGIPAESHGLFNCIGVPALIFLAFLALVSLRAIIRGLKETVETEGLWADKIQRELAEAQAQVKTQSRPIQRREVAKVKEEPSQAMTDYLKAKTHELENRDKRNEERRLAREKRRERIAEDAELKIIRDISDDRTRINATKKFYEERNERIRNIQ